MTEVKIDPQAAFDRVSSWSDKVGTAFNTVSAAFSAMSDLSLGGDGFSTNAVGFVNGVRGVQSKVQAVARASTDADLGGMSSYDMVQAAIDSALEQKEADDAERAALIEKAEKYGSSFPPPDEYDSIKEIPVEDLEEINQFLQENEDDDEVMAAFYGALPAENLLAYTANLPKVKSKDAKYQPGTGDDVSKAQAEFLRLIGGTMGEGSRKGFLPPSYADDLVDAALDDQLWQRPDWALSEILQTGDYSADFLTTIGDGLWAREDENDPTHTWGWRPDSPEMKVVGYNDELNPDPIKSVLDAMHRSSESRDALQSFVYPPGGDSRAAKLIDRYWGEEIGEFDRVAKTFEVLAIPDPDANDAEMEQAATAATDAVQLLPGHYANKGVTTAARGSMANILTFYWPDVDAVMGTSRPGDKSPGVDELEWSTGRVEFTRDQAEAALGVTMDLDDFDADNSAIGTSPSGRVMTAAANFNDFRTRLALGSSAADPISSTAPTFGELNSSFKLNVDRLGFVTQAGFQDELDDASDRDAKLGVFRSFTIKAVSTAATIGGSAAGTAAGGPVAGKIVGAGANWATNQALESWVPEPGAADGVNDSIDGIGADIVEAEKVRWASEVWDADLPEGLDFKRGKVPTSPDELEGQDRETEADQVLEGLGLATEALPTFEDGRKRAAED